MAWVTLLYSRSCTAFVIAGKIEERKTFQIFKKKFLQSKISYITLFLPLVELLKKTSKIEKSGKKNVKNKVFVETNTTKEPITVIIRLKNKKSRNKKINQQLKKKTS